MSGMPQARLPQSGAGWRETTKMRPSEGWFFGWIGMTFAVMLVWLAARYGCLMTAGGPRCYDFVGRLAFLQWPLIALLQMLFLLRYRRDAWQWALAIAAAGLIGSGLDHLTWTVRALGRLGAYVDSRLGGPLDVASVWAWQWGVSLIHFLLIGLAGALVLAGWRWRARAWMVGMVLLGVLATPASMAGIAVPATPDNSWGGPFSSLMALVSGFITSLVTSVGTGLAIRETMRRTPMQTPSPPLPVWR
jgi:hypothetical protein